MAGDRGGEHPLAEESGMHRLMSGTAAGDDRDGRATRIGDDRGRPGDESVIVPAGIGMGGDKAAE